MKSKPTTSKNITEQNKMHSNAQNKTKVRNKKILILFICLNEDIKFHINFKF